MSSLSIGQVARVCGLAPSAIRYYEKAGLLPAPPRRSRQRRYDENVVGRIELIRIARAAGFTIRETRLLLSGFSANVPPAERWRVLAALTNAAHRQSRSGAGRATAAAQLAA